MWRPGLGHPQDARHTPVVQKAFWLWDTWEAARPPSPSPCRGGPDGACYFRPYESLFCVLLPVVMCGVSSILGMLCVVEVVGNEENQCRTPSWRICARAVAPLSAGGAGRGRDESEPRRACRQHQLSAGERGQRARNAANANAPRRAGGRPYRVLILRCNTYGSTTRQCFDDLFTVPDSNSAPDTRPSPHDTAGV